MATNKSAEFETVHAIWDLLRIHKDGSIERLMAHEVVPASTDPKTGVQSKDVIISPETGVSVRIYIPKNNNNKSPDNHKLPLLFYFHGGGFCISTASFPPYHNYLNSLVAAANIVVVSVDYRRAPEHPLPVAFDDSWEAVKWAVTSGAGGDEWVKNFADLNRVFFAGDSAGGNIAYQMGIRVGLDLERLFIMSGAKLVGNILIHPYFGGEEPIGSEPEKMSAKLDFDNLWRIVWPSVTSLDDPVINPSMDPNIARMGCQKLLVCVAEKDGLRDRGVYFYEAMKSSGWKGKVEVVEAVGEDHVFHLFNPTCENALAFMKLLVSFFNEKYY